MGLPLATIRRATPDTGTRLDVSALIPPGPPAPRRYRFLWPVVNLSALVAAALLLVAHASPYLAVALPAGIVVAYLAIEDPFVALVVLQVVSWSNISTVVGSHHGLSLYLVGLAVGVISLIVAVRRGACHVLGRSPIYALVAGVVAVGGLSLLASPYPLSSLATPNERLKDVAFFFVTVGLFRVTGRYLAVVRIIVITIVVLAALTIVQEYILHDSTTLGGLSNIPSGAGVGGTTARHSGSEVDPNFWGRIIVLVTPLCLALFMIRVKRGLAAFGWILAALMLAGGIYLSQSRGGLIGFGVATIGFLVLAAWRHPRWLAILPVALVLLFVTVPQLSSRLGTLGQLTNVSVGSTDASLVGRVEAQQVGLKMFLANPATGVGLGDFMAVEPSFVSLPGVIDTGRILAPHDLYLELAAEQGVLGLGMWVLFYGAVLLICLRATILARDAGRPELGIVARGALLALIGWAVSSAVLQMADANDLLAVVALVTVVDMDLRRGWAGFPPTSPGRAPGASAGNGPGAPRCVRPSPSWRSARWRRRPRSLRCRFTAPSTRPKPAPQYDPRAHQTAVARRTCGPPSAGRPSSRPSLTSPPTRGSCAKRNPAHRAARHPSAR